MGASKLVAWLFLAGLPWAMAAAQSPERRLADRQAQLLNWKNAPERTVYVVSFRELLAVQARAEELEQQGMVVAAVSARAYFRRLTGLDDADYSLLTSIARQCTASIESRRAESAQLMGQVGPASAGRADSALVARLDEGIAASVDEAVGRLRSGLGVRFASLDQRIRQHVVPGLRILTATGVAVGGPQDGK